jgi:hypothetical protein
VESLLQDIRFAFCMVRESLGFTAVAILALAFGIGANAAIFGMNLLREVLPCSKRVSFCCSPFCL